RRRANPWHCRILLGRQNRAWQLEAELQKRSGSLVRIFHKHCSRRREEADFGRVPTAPPPHVGGYHLSALQSRYEICGLEASGKGANFLFHSVFHFACPAVLSRRSSAQAEAERRRACRALAERRRVLHFVETNHSR